MKHQHCYSYWRVLKVYSNREFQFHGKELLMPAGLLQKNIKITGSICLEKTWNKLHRLGKNYSDIDNM